MTTTPRSNLYGGSELRYFTMRSSARRTPPGQVGKSAMTASGLFGRLALKAPGVPRSSHGSVKLLEPVRLPHRPTYLQLRQVPPLQRRLQVLGCHCPRWYCPAQDSEMLTSPRVQTRNVVRSSFIQLDSPFSVLDLVQLNTKSTGESSPSSPACLFSPLACSGGLHAGPGCHTARRHGAVPVWSPGPGSLRLRFVVLRVVPLRRPFAVGLRNLVSSFCYVLVCLSPFLIVATAVCSRILLWVGRVCW